MDILPYLIHIFVLLFLVTVVGVLRFLQDAVPKNRDNEEGKGTNIYKPFIDSSYPSVLTIQLAPKINIWLVLQFRYSKYSTKEKKIGSYTGLSVGFLKGKYSPYLVNEGGDDYF